MSYDVAALFTDVPVDDTIDILVEKAFENDWFNQTSNTNLNRVQLVELLQIAVKNQLFQFEGRSYERIDGVAMGSPLGPLMANAIMCSIEETLQRHGKLPQNYKRYVDDTVTLMTDIVSANNFHQVLNSAHPSIKFTMGIEQGGRLPFLGIWPTKNGSTISTEVYRKFADTGLLLHYQNHFDRRYKTGLVKTMLNRGKRLSSTNDRFKKECEKIREIFSGLKYLEARLNMVIFSFLKNQDTTKENRKDLNDQSIDILLPLKTKSRWTW